MEGYVNMRYVNKTNVWFWTSARGLRLGPVKGSCDYGTETCGFRGAY
jgi:hypothetical protein